MGRLTQFVPAAPPLVRSSALQSFCDFKQAATCSSEQITAFKRLFVCAEEYYRLISRAVAALEINSFEDRRAIYNRARAVQSRQLGKVPYKKAQFDRELGMYFVLASMLLVIRLAILNAFSLMIVSHQAETTTKSGLVA